MDASSIIKHNLSCILFVVFYENLPIDSSKTNTFFSSLFTKMVFSHNTYF